jgi:hypothetical protein
VQPRQDCSVLQQAEADRASFHQQIEVLCRHSETLGSLSTWLDLHSSSSGSLASLTHISVKSVRHICFHQQYLFQAQLSHLPCAHLQLHGLTLQLEQAGDAPGVLHECTGLTALDLEDCLVEDAHAAFAAIAALPELQHLRMYRVSDEQEGFHFWELPHPLQLTFLEVIPGAAEPVPFVAEYLRQLPAMESLQHLNLQNVCSQLPGGLALSADEAHKLAHVLRV